jgi:hypothetical protein
VLDQTAS